MVSLCMYDHNPTGRCQPAACRAGPTSVASSRGWTEHESMCCRTKSPVDAPAGAFGTRARHVASIARRLDSRPVSCTGCGQARMHWTAESLPGRRAGLTRCTSMTACASRRTCGGTPSSSPATGPPACSRSHSPRAARGRPPDDRRPAGGRSRRAAAPCAPRRGPVTGCTPPAAAAAPARAWMACELLLRMGRCLCCVQGLCGCCGCRLRFEPTTCALPEWRWLDLRLKTGRTRRTGGVCLMSCQRFRA